MNEETLEQLRHLIQTVFPPATVVGKVTEGDRGIITVSWRLGDLWTENWSRQIRIVFAGNVLERLEKLNERGRVKANNNLISLVRIRLGEFNPRHDRPRYHLPPSEIWEVTYQDLFPAAKS